MSEPAGDSLAGSSSDHSLAGRIAVVTGTGGLGLEAALMLARRGAEIVLAGRTEAKGAAAVKRINDTQPGVRARFERLDLASLFSVKEFADRLTHHTARVDILINNAGVMMPPARKLTCDGFELQFGTNHLGHFALTARLLPMLQAAPRARAVSIGSLAHKRGTIDFDDLQSERRYRPFSAYAQSKLAVLLFASELHRRSEARGWGLISNAAHPGYARTDLIANGPGNNAVSSRISRRLEPLISHSAADGARPVLYAATSSSAKGGDYFGPTGFMEFKGPPGKAKVSKAGRNREVAHRLWEVSEQLVGFPFDQFAVPRPEPEQKDPVSP